jgi:spermidine synthase
MQAKAPPTPVAGPTRAPRAPAAGRLGIAVFLVCFAAILLEIAYTRVFSYKLFYFFTYLTIGIALLGTGAGGIFLALSPRLRRIAPERLVAGACLLAAVAVPVGYLVVARIQLDAVDIAERPAEALDLAHLCTWVFLPYLGVGLALATAFGARPDRIHRLYFADLTGAGLGCALVIPLFASISPPGCVMLAGALFAAAGLVLVERLALRAAGGALAAACAAAALAADRLPDPLPDRLKIMSPELRKQVPVRFTGWGPVFRVDVLDGFDPQRNLWIAHDGGLGSNLIAFDGDMGALRRFDTDVRSTPFEIAVPGPEVLVVGAAGGHEVLASLYFGAKHVTGVELNPVTVSLLREHFADYTGRIAEDPRVTLVMAEGRAFLKRAPQRYDLVWFVAPDTYAAQNAASSAGFVLSESYLYTRETIVEALLHLRERGILCMQNGDIDFERKPNRAARWLNTARAALESLGVRDVSRHVLVSETPEFLRMVTTCVRREPFDAAELARFRANVARVMPVGKPGQVVHPREDGTAPAHLLQKIAALPRAELARELAGYPYDVSPVRDDAPFFWHFASFRRAIAEPGWKGAIFDPEDAIGERVLLALLAFAALFGATWLLLPLLLARATWRRIPHKRYALAYFAALGMGFMFYEVVLIQKLTLFLGYPTRSLSVTLFALLAASGAGSLLAPRWASGRTRSLLGLLAGLAALTLLYRFGLTPLVEALVGLPLAARVALAVAFLAPLGLCLGAFMPLGLATVAATTEHDREYVAWAWAVNGFCSVVASVLATVLSMSFGFHAVLALAVAIYAAGVAALLRIPQARDA